MATAAILESLTDAYRPQRIADFCGLEKQKKILLKLAARPKSCALLFEGAPGTGKTSIAYAFAREIGAEVHHIGSQEATIDGVKSAANSCRYAPMFGTSGFHVVIMDEANKMSPATQLFLLSRLDGTEACPKTIWVFTCNDVDGLSDAFLSRVIGPRQGLAKFNAYGASGEIKDLLARVWVERADGAPVPDMSKVPTGNVREALQWLEVELLAA